MILPIGTGSLIRLILRRDRILLPAWLLATAGVVLGRASTIGDTYPTAAARQERFEMVSNIPMFLLFQSPAYGTSPGALVAQEAFGGVTMVAALGAVIFLVRHTRGDERSGRRELLGSTVLGRHAPLTAILTVLLGSGLLLAALVTTGLLGLGFPGSGSLAMGLVSGAAIWVATPFAAVAVQVTENPRLAGFAAFGLFYGLHLVRGAAAIVGDGVAWLGWAVPNGWLQQVRPFAGDRWWALGLVLVLAAALVWGAYALSARRDLGAGLLPARLGPAAGGRWPNGPLGLAWRLHRGSAFGWGGAALFLGLGTGVAGGTGAMQQYAQGGWLREYAGAAAATNPTEAFFLYLAVLLSMTTGFYVVLATLRLRAEEQGGGAELVLAGPIGRLRWAASHLVCAMGASAGIIVVLGLGFGVGSGLAGGSVRDVDGGSGIAGEVMHMLGITIAMIPAVWAMSAITTAAFGLWGRVSTALAWIALTVALVTDLAVHWGLPEWVFRTLSPFAHVNPFYAPGAANLAGLFVVAAVLVAAGLAGLRRRDLAV